MDLEQIQKCGRLLGVCEAFIRDQTIYCPETIYQTDRVIAHAYEFIEAVCEIVGYLPSENDEASDD